MARLVYVDCSQPGISRKRSGRGFSYYMPDGSLIGDNAERMRLNAIALPPAYSDCWFCTLPNGHLQATGFDDAGRKQYRYHVDFRSARERDKYDRCAAFGEALPTMRERVAGDLRKRKVGRDRALAAVVRLLDLGLVRIGNDQYVAQNKSYGATTLRDEHAQLKSTKLRLRYTAKHGKQRDLDFDDAALMRYVRDVQDLPGQEIFRFVDDDDIVHDIKSQDVNAYIHDTMGGDFSAKNFRTFGASALAFEQLVSAEEPLTVKALVAPIAEALGNTPATARKAYIHPTLIDFCGEPLGELQRLKTLQRDHDWLQPAETGLIGLLS